MSGCTKITSLTSPTEWSNFLAEISWKTGVWHYRGISSTDGGIKIALSSTALSKLITVENNLLCSV